MQKGHNFILCIYKEINTNNKIKTDKKYIINNINDTKKMFSFYTVFYRLFSI